MDIDSGGANVRPTIDNPASLERAWRRLMRPWHGCAPAIWMMLIAPDGQPVPELVEIADLPAEVSDEDRAVFAQFLRMLGDDLDTQLRLAFLLTRPGPARPTPRDRAWATTLYAACREAQVQCEVVHLAGDEGVRPLPWDELGSSAATCAG